MSVSSSLKFDSTPMMLGCFYSQVSKDEIRIIKNALTYVYKDRLEVFVEDELELLEEAYNKHRNQYDAEYLLGYLIKNKKKDAGLWVVNSDIYVNGMNFVFGLARFFKGAVLSIYRLSSRGLIEKEAVHEVGHVLGLTHCSNNCVMQYSNSLSEARVKPFFLCETCRRKIDSIL